VPFDLWWFRLPRSASAVYSLIPHTKPGRALIMIPRVGYYQIAYLIPKGADARLRELGLDAFKAELAPMIPELPAEAFDGRLLGRAGSQPPTEQGSGRLRRADHVAGSPVRRRGKPRVGVGRCSRSSGGPFFDHSSRIGVTVVWGVSSHSATS
jgi:hypothetical protein